MTSRALRLVQTSPEEHTELAGVFATALLGSADSDGTVPARSKHPGRSEEEVRARLSSPMRVRRVSDEGVPFHALRPGAPGRSEDLGRFEDRSVAHLMASVLPAGAYPNPFVVGDREPGAGYPVFQDGLILGHVEHPDTELPARLHLAYTYATHLESLAHLLEALGDRALIFLGRLLARRRAEERGEARG